MQGYQAENLDLKRQLEHLQNKHVPEKKIERNLSAINLIECVSEGVQTDQVKDTINFIDFE